MRLGKKILGVFAGIMCLGALASCSKGGSETTPKEEKLYDKLEYSGYTYYEDESVPVKKTATSEEEVTYKSKREFFIWFKTNMKVNIISIDVTFTYKSEDYSPTDPESDFGSKINYTTYIVNPATDSLVNEDNLSIFNCRESLESKSKEQKTLTNQPHTEKNTPYSFNYPINRVVEHNNYFVFRLQISQATFSNLKINYEKQ